MPMRSALFHSRTFFESPLLIVGPGRSGTGVLKRALGQHPQVMACDGESPFIARAATITEQFEFDAEHEYHRRASQIPLERVYEQTRRMCFEVAFGPRLGARRFLREVIRAKKPLFGLRRWCAKTFPDRSQGECLLRLYPSVKLLYIFRDGCETVHSRTRFAPMRDRPFEEHCADWAEQIARYEYLRNAPFAQTIRHEELTANPHGVFAELWDFLELDPEEKTVEFIRSTLFHPLDEGTQTSVDARAALSERPPPSESWTTEQKEMFKKLCGESMATLGYAIPF